ncbi:unnamed protein product [Bursaphelenchus xylophilus]|uniref:Small ribosomal subunit protein uS10m n=1 Tax=Bursaphelenchus xylophilus TaxID=6326 RepID=A0A1I7RPV8_BURXY|nr:unnamed protein product [Bursaphelenchus xylophilus]CAG9096699.1 unnamed protein product [Bursaphelenchus xylophilus]
MLKSLLGRSLFFNAKRGLQKASDAEVTNISDKLFSKIQLEVRGHDKAVLLSYTNFIKNACQNLQIETSRVRHLRYHKWIQPLLRAKFARKKYKLHYEIRTQIKQVDIYNVTGSTSSTFLEYAQRNIPEGVAMRVDYNEICALPEPLRKSIQN